MPEDNRNVLVVEAVSAYCIFNGLSGRLDTTIYCVLSSNWLVDLFDPVAAIKHK